MHRWESELRARQLPSKTADVVSSPSKSRSSISPKITSSSGGEPGQLFEQATARANLHRAPISSSAICVPPQGRVELGEKGEALGVAVGRHAAPEVVAVLQRQVAQLGQALQLETARARQVRV